MKQIPLFNLLTLLLLCFPLACQGQPQSPQKTRQADAFSNLARPVTGIDWLSHFAQRLKQVQTLQAQLVYTRIDGVGLLDDLQTRTGTFYYQGAKPIPKTNSDSNAKHTPKPKTPDAIFQPAQFAAHFTQLIVDQRPQAIDQWYRFDGHWLVDRNDKEKILTKIQLVPLSQQGQQEDPLATGQGPFFLPITADVQRILKRFDVKLIPQQKTDPPNCVHLKLTAKPKLRLEVQQIDIWYNLKNALPIRTQTLDDAPNQQIVALTQIKRDLPLNQKTFDTTVPPQRGWQVTIQRYQKTP